MLNGDVFFEALQQWMIKKIKFSIYDWLIAHKKFIIDTKVGKLWHN